MIKVFIEVFEEWRILFAPLPLSSHELSLSSGLLLRLVRTGSLNRYIEASLLDSGARTLGEELFGEWRLLNGA